MNSLLKGRVFLPIAFFSLLLLPFLLLINKYSPPAELVPEGYSSSIIAFEFVQNKADLIEVLSPLSEQQSDDLDKLNYVDFGFMIAYTLILFLFARRHALEFPSFLARIALFLPMVILLSDLAENIQLLHLNHLFKEGAEEYYDIHIGQLKLYTWMKWGNLALYFLLIGLHSIKIKAPFYGVGALMILPFLGLLASVVVHERKVWDVFAGSIFLMFLLILLYSILYKKRSNAQV